jgi:hypothetical protein
MKTTQYLTTLAVAAGFLTTAALADSSPSTSAAGTVQPTAPVQIIYAPQLPSVAELTSVAAAQGITVKQIVQSARDVSITTQSADGQTKTVSYQLLADAGARPAQIAAPAVVYAVPPTPAPYDYDSYAPYYPEVYYPPVSVRLGFGYGYRGGRRW